MKKFKTFFSSVWKQLKDRTNIIIFLIVLVVLYAPTWFVGLLGLLFKSTAMVGVATAYAAFWAGPFTPFFPVVISVTFAVRKIVDKVRGKKVDFERFSKYTKEEKEKCRLADLTVSEIKTVISETQFAKEIDVEIATLRYTKHLSQEKIAEKVGYQRKGIQYRLSDIEKRMNQTLQKIIG